MLNSGLIPILVVDSHKASLWKQVFPGLTLHEEVAVRSGARIAKANKSTPLLEEKGTKPNVHYINKYSARA